MASRVWASAAGAMACVVLVGCGGGLRVAIRRDGPPITEAQAAERLSLGAAEVRPGADPDDEIARLMQLATLAETLEQRADAIGAAMGAVRLAQGHAYAHPSEASTGRRSRVERAALGILDRLADHEGVLSLAESSIDGASSDVLTRALSPHHEGAPLNAAVWARLDAQGRAHADWAGRRPLGVAPVSLDDIRSLGTDGVPLLEQRILDAAALGDAAALRAAVRALASIDGVHPMVLGCDALARDIERGVVPGDAIFACAGLADSLVTGSAIARLMLLSSEASRSEAAVVSLALSLHWAGAEGDARALALPHVGSSDRDVALLASGLVALADLSLGEVATWDALEAAHGEVRQSPGWFARLWRATSDDPRDPVTVLARRARRALGTRGPLGIDLAVDAEAPLDLRRAALDAYARRAPSHARMVASCIADALSTDACIERLDALDALADSNAENVALFDTAGDALPVALLFDHLDAPWVDAMGLAAAAWLDRRRASADAYGEAWVHARLRVALAAGDVAAARALLAERGQVVSSGLRAAAALAIPSIEAGEAFYGLSPATLPELLPAGVVPTLEEGAPILGYACLIAPATVDQETAESCLSFLSRLESEAPELLAGARAIYGTALGLPLDWPALATAASGAPESTAATMIAALAAESAGDVATAAERFLALTLADSSLVGVDRRYLRHAHREGAPLTAIAGAIGASEPYSTAGRDVADLVRAQRIDDPELLVRLYDLDARAFATLGGDVVRHRRFVDSHEQSVVGALRQTPEPTERRALARELSPMLVAIDAVANARLLRAQMALLAGDAAGADAAARRPIRWTGDSLPLPETTDIHDMIAAGPAATPDLIDHLLLMRPTGRRRTAEALAAHLAPLEAMAAADPRLLPLLCGELVRGGQSAAALDACARVHAASPTPLSYARLSAPLASLDAPAGIDAESFFREGRTHATGNELAVLLWNDALRLAREGREEESARAALESQRAGFHPAGVGTWEMAQVRERGLELRARAESGADRTYLSLAEGDAELAWHYARAAQREVQRTEAEDDPAYASLCNAIDLAFWAHEDAAAGRIDREGLAAWDRLRSGGFESDELDALAARYPDALVMRLALAVRDVDRNRHREAYEAIQPLLERAPRGMLAVLFRRSIGLASSRAEADETVARLRTRFPDDPRLLEAGAAILPEPLLTAAALEAVLAEVQDADFARLEPELRVDPGGHAMAAFPRASEPLPTMFGAQMGSVRLFAAAEARLAHCEGGACLDSILPTFDAMGMSTVWRSEASTQFGPGARALLSGPGGAGLLTVVPRGSVLFVLGVFGTPEAIAVRLRTFALLERSFSPIDVVVPSGWATVLAGSASAAPIDARIQALRAVSAASGEGCPIRAQLDALPDADAREALVRQLYLGRAEPAQRAALLSCIDGGSGHALLGLAATLDPTAAHHTRGRTLLASDGAAARNVVEELLALDPGRPLSGVAHRDSALPSFAAVELIVALPTDARRSLTNMLWARGDAASRGMAIVAEQLLAGSLDHALVRETIRGAPPGEAIAAADVLYGSHDPVDLAAARDRLDGMRAPIDGPTRTLALRLVWELARRLDRDDVARFSTIAERLRETGAARTGEGERRLYEWSAEQVDEELAVLRASLERNPGELPEAVEATLETYRGMRRLTERPRTSARVASMLATESLARVLPGAHWSYVRVPSPSLLIATLESMYQRLESSSASDGALARQSLAFMLEQANAALLGPDGGLDLSRPIECATADRFPRSWVCAVYVSDAERVRDVLAERRYGTNSGAWLAVEAARQARSLPIAAGGMPYELADTLSEEPPPPPGAAGAIVLRERARTEVDLDGVRMLRYGTFVAREGEDTGVDTEHYLFTGDRLVMFGLEESARAILAEPLPVTRTLAGQPRFRALTEGWTDGSVLQLVNVGFRARMLPEPLPDADMGLELSAWDEGLVGRIRMPFTESTAGVDTLLARLPEGALSSMSFVREAGREMAPAPEAAPGAADWRSYLLERADRFALGWYGAAESGESARERVWGQWTLALGASEMLRSELTSWSAWPEDGRTVRRDGLAFGRAGETLVVGTDEAAVSRALAVPGPGRAREAIVGSARLDGVRTAAVARSLSDGLRRDDPRRESIELLAAILGLAREVSFEARADARRRELVITARVTPNLGPPGEDHALIDELLRHARNAVTLPRALSASELRRTVRWTLTTGEPDVVAARGFGGHPRVTAEVRDPTTLVLTVRPSDATATALTATQRASLLASTRAIRSDDEAVLARARALAPPGTSAADAARAIVTWVHDNIRYELTAEELDAPTVLERGRGDCTELARITTALLRAAGVPAEMREGFLVVGAEAGAHAWVAYHDGTGFKEIDPTAGRADVDAGYVPSSVLTVMGMAAIGDLRVTEVTPVP